MYCKWSIQQTTKTQVIKQCIGGSYHKKEVASNSRASAACYSYVGCFAFAAIYIYDNEICGIAGFLEHFVQYILAQNARTVKNVFRNKTDRLEIIISTQEQQDYAWQYGHKNLILVDGTFGISKHKLLLFTIMLNIINPFDRKILKQEFLQVTYLSPSIKCDESTKKLLDMNKVIKYEIEDSTGNIYVEVESETTPELIYTTCVYGQPTNICCQCLDFFQKGIICKHLRAAALYIDELCKQEQYSHLPEITFLTYKETQIMPSSTSFAQNQPSSKVIDINRLNVTVIHRQKFKEFLESTSRKLCNTDQYALQTHLHNIIASNSFKEAQILVDVMHEDMNPRRSIISDTDILSLAYEAKQQRKPSYKSF
ncbi:19656_t:CDS:2 [Cetraspora pellucida]|uniref:19656_t:CDS:1 n=1 Tax=Cetraspora pellucida TaxID=1433469 RepID=A0A9N9JVZ2_9GLOM|nr:19656_t:CDS:2 [Cetraspora pellucida]